MNTEQEDALLDRYARLYRAAFEVYTAIAELKAMGSWPEGDEELIAEDLFEALGREVPRNIALP